jgi:hypothetical protein
VFNSQFLLPQHIKSGGLKYRQIYNLRTLVLKLYIFGNAVKYKEFKATERSERVLKFGT